MSVVVIDDATREKLLAAGEEVVFQDSAGTVVGRFIRQLTAADYELIDVPFTDDEIARHKQDPTRYTGEEVEERLRRLRRCG